VCVSVVECSPVTATAGISQTPCFGSQSSGLVVFSCDIDGEAFWQLVPNVSASNKVPSAISCFKLEEIN
jgi:hypothetical protein